MFSQILGINDKGIAVGYYGDSTTSQHGFLYNTHTGVYTFLDDPSEAFDNGVEVTQITGINNSGEITGLLLRCQRRLPWIRRHHMIVDLEQLIGPERRPRSGLFLRSQFGRFSMSTLLTAPCRK